jgi:hypothetical protein
MVTTAMAQALMHRNGSFGRGRKIISYNQTGREVKTAEL